MINIIYGFIGIMTLTTVISIIELIEYKVWKKKHESII
jgi:hypothetical protein